MSILFILYLFIYFILLLLLFLLVDCHDDASIFGALTVTVYHRKIVIVLVIAIISLQDIIYGSAILAVLLSAVACCLWLTLEV